MPTAAVMEPPKEKRMPTILRMNSVDFHKFTVESKVTQYLFSRYMNAIARPRAVVEKATLA